VYALFIPYALANIFSFFCVCIGICSFVCDGVLPGRKVQDIIDAARDAAVHRHLSPGARKMSMMAVDDGKGDVVIRLVDVDVEEAGVSGRRFVWGVMSSRKREGGEEC
jgi:hypothetical protein